MRPSLRRASGRASSPRPDVEDDRPVRPSRSCVHRTGRHTEHHCEPSRRCSEQGFDASAQAKPALGLGRPRYGSGMLRSPAIGNRPRASRLRRSKPASRRRGKPVRDRVRWIGFYPEQPKRPGLSGLRRRQSVGLIESSAQVAGHDWRGPNVPTSLPRPGADRDTEPLPHLRAAPRSKRSRRMRGLMACAAIVNFPRRHPDGWSQNSRPSRHRTGHLPR